MKNVTRLPAMIVLSACFSVSAMGQTVQSTRQGHEGRPQGTSAAFLGQKPAAAKTNATNPAERGETLYRDGMQALNNQQWQAAITNFSRLAAARSKRSDEALYWKAYAQNKEGLRADALRTLQDLRSSFPRSRWLDDARALAIQVRQASGETVSPKDQPNDQLKLLAINGLMTSDPDRAIPLLEQLIDSNQPIAVKERALFVLTQSGSPKARQAVVEIARSNPDSALRKKALDDLALFGGERSRQLLAQIYTSSNDLALKQHILHDFMISGDTEQLLEIAKTDKAPELREAAINQLGLAGGQDQLGSLYQQETNKGVKKAILRAMVLGQNRAGLIKAARTDSDPEMRLEAIHDLGLMGAQTQLAELYRQESALDVKKAILHSIFLGQNSKALTQIARTETNPELRVEAIHSLGLIRDPQSSGALVSLYASNPDQATRRAVVDALFIQDNARALVALARQETDPAMKKLIVSRLSLMHSKEATDYMLEILGH